MQRLTSFIRVLVVLWLGLWPIGPSSAADADLTTPEGAAAAFLDGLARQDFDKVLSTTHGRPMSESFDFVAYVEWNRSQSSITPAPSGDPFFAAINRAVLAGHVAYDVKKFIYGLMAEEAVEGRPVAMDAAGAAEFMDVVQAKRLAGLKLVKIGIPKLIVSDRVRFQTVAARLARAQGADDWTERLALLSFEGQHFTTGFSMLRYGDGWYIGGLQSSVSLITRIEKSSPDEFDNMVN